MPIKTESHNPRMSDFETFWCKSPFISRIEQTELSLVNLQDINMLFNLSLYEDLLGEVCYVQRILWLPARLVRILKILDLSVLRKPFLVTLRYVANGLFAHEPQQASFSMVLMVYIKCSREVFYNNPFFFQESDIFSE